MRPISRAGREEEGREGVPDQELGRGEKSTVCFMCSSECGLIVRVEADGTLAIRGDPRHPMNAGKLCPKAPLAEELRTSPDRIRTPLRRVGARGGGVFVEIGWEVALREIGRELRRVGAEFGPESLTVLFGEKPDHDVVYSFARAFGTPNVLDHNSLCDTNRRLGFALTYGRDQERPLPDLQRPLVTEDGLRERHDCRLLVLFGENPAEARRFFWEWEGIKRAKREGMRLIVVDPFMTRTADLADVWLPIRPGTDAALILAMLRYVVECDGVDGGLLDWEFIGRYTKGWEELRSSVLTRDRDPENGEVLYSVDWAAVKTGLPALAIRDLAREFGATKPAAAMVGMNGIAHHYGGFQATRGLAILLAVTGNLDVPGGVLLREGRPPNPLRDGAEGVAASLQYKHKDIYGDHPLASHGVVARVPTDILDGIRIRHGPLAGHAYSTRALFVIHHNPLLTAPETRRWIEAFTARERDGAYRLRLLVANDIWVHDTAMYADYVLPMAHFLERQGIVFNETSNPVVSLRQAVVAAPPGCRSPLEIFRHLADEMGDAERFADLLRLRDDDDWCDLVLQGVMGDGEAPGPTERLRRMGGIYRRPLRYRKYRHGGFQTPSGKVELVATCLQELGAATGSAYPPGVIYEDSPPRASRRAAAVEAREGAGVFRLISGRSLFHTNAITQNLSTPRCHASPVVWMHPLDAAESGVASGMRVTLRGSKGDVIHAEVQVTERIRRGVLRGQHGWGAASPYLGAARRATYNINRLTDGDNVHPVTGNVGFGDVFVTIAPVDGPTRHDAVPIRCGASGASSASSPG